MDIPVNSGHLEISAVCEIGKDPKAGKEIFAQFAARRLSDTQLEQLFSNKHCVADCDKWTILARVAEQEIHVRHPDGYPIGVFFPDQGTPPILFH